MLAGCAFRAPFAGLACGSSSEQGSPDASALIDSSSASADVAIIGSDAGNPSDAALGSESGSAHEAAPWPPDPCVEAGTCPPGQWVNVTPTDMNPDVLAPTTNAFGPGAIASDASHPSDLYIGAGNDGIWKSTDYGSSWTRINSTIAGSPIGTPIAVAGTTPATIWVKSRKGNGSVYKSTDGGVTFNLIGGGQTADLYSIVVDPYDSTHLVSGRHEADRLVESTDGGNTWRWNRLAFGGNLLVPVLRRHRNRRHDASDMVCHCAGRRCSGHDDRHGGYVQHSQRPGEPERRRREWASAPARLHSARPEGLDAPRWRPLRPGPGRVPQHGSRQELVSCRHRTGSRGHRVVDTEERLRDVGLGVLGLQSGDELRDGRTTRCQLVGGLSADTVPAALIIGPNSLAVTSDGSHSIFVGVMWAEGIWRYVEP
jgi:hypothetical protein